MNSKYLAGVSLAVMALGFGVTLWVPETTAVILLRGSFEAGLVGGVADWFAVTALFRHPFGIPIPHTSLLLKNKDRIIRSLISAVENELLNKQSITAKIRSLQVLELTSSLLTRLLRKRKVRESLLKVLEQQLRKLPIEHYLSPVQDMVSNWIRNRDMKSDAEALSKNIIQSGFDHKSFDYVITGVLSWLQREDTQSLLGKLAYERLSAVKAGGMMGFALQAFTGFINEQKLGSILQEMLHSTVQNLLDKENPTRERLIRELHELMFRFAGDDERISLVKEWAASHVQGARGTDYLHTRLEEIRSLLLEKLSSERLKGGRAVFSCYRWIHRSIRNEPDWIVTAEERLSQYIVDLVAANHYRIGQLIKENFERMDNDALIEMLEDKLGKDLQWIRVNGAICGFAVGFLLTLLQVM